MHKLGPAELGDLLEAAAVAVLATYRRDGGVLLSPVWHRWREDGFDVVVGPNDVKLQHLRRDPRRASSSTSISPHTGAWRREVRRASIRRARQKPSPRWLSATSARRTVPRTPTSVGDSVLVRLEGAQIRGWDFADDMG